MLPVIELECELLCKTGFSPHTSRIEPIGDAFLFDLQAVIHSAKSNKLSLDRFLTLKIAPFLVRKKLRSNVLILYTPFSNRFILSVCSLQKVSLFGVLHSTGGMPGYLEYGRDYVQPIASPFLFYGGMQVYRVYSCEYPEANEYYLCDFGNQFGMCVEKASHNDYVRIRDNPVEYVDYSPVPLEPSESVKINGIAFELQYSFCKWKRGLSKPSS